MLRPRLRHQFLKMKTYEAKAKHNQQSNICVSLSRKAKRNYYESLDLSKICDNKKFGANLKPLFSNKVKFVENIAVSENRKLTKGKEEVANIFNDFLVNIVPNLGIRTQHEFLNTTDSSQNLIEDVICKNEDPPSIILIKKHMEETKSSIVTKEKIEKLVTKVCIRRAIPFNDTLQN